MSASDPKSLSSLGFLTFLDVQDVGLLGGFLAVNPTGRPLEFHCTTPVRASRAQEILYGKTLRSYLCGELIGQALLDKAKSRPELILTDQESMLATREFCGAPVVCITWQPSDNKVPPGIRIDSAHGQPAPFALGRYQACLPAAFQSDREQVSSLWTQVDALDAEEPFQRIREAIEETVSN